MVFRVSAGIPAAFLLLFLAKINSHKLSIPKNKWKPLFFISLCNVTLWQVLMLYGVSLLGGGRAAVLGYTMPVWAVMVAAMMGYEKITISSFIALCLGVFGVISLAAGIDFFSNWVGIFVMLMAGFSWGVGTIILKYGGLKFDAFVIAGWQQLIGILPIIPFAILWDLNNIGDPDYRHFLVLIFAIFFASAYTYWAYFTVLQKFYCYCNFYICYDGSSFSFTDRHILFKFRYFLLRFMRTFNDCNGYFCSSKKTI